VIGPIPAVSVDPLGEALHLLRMDGAFYCRSELQAPWGLRLPPLDGHLWFHVVTNGALHLESGEMKQMLGPGEVALVSHGQGHALRSGPEASTPDILSLDRERVSDRYEVLRHGEGGQPTLLLCGAVRFAHPVATTLMALLPDVVYLPAGTERLQTTLSLLAAEAREPRIGGEAVLTRLADIIVIQAVRAWIESDPAAEVAWFGALRDPQIGRAITLIHRDPGRDWTVASLARELNRSRSSFAARFTALVGEPVMAYLTRWRMQMAMAALREEPTTVAQLAGRLGYQSEAAFARTFKRHTGVPPGGVHRLPDPFAS
jgi:AraC-like DNA-binding protein